MRGFYDNILPKAVNKWARKFGGKVGMLNMASPEIMPFKFAIHAKGESEPHSLYRTRAEAEKDLLSFNNPGLLEVRPYSAHDDRSYDAPSIDLTPAMRDAALAGQPLFSQNNPKGQDVRDLSPLEAARRIGADSSACWVVEDSVGGVTAAKAAAPS